MLREKNKAFSILYVLTFTLISLPFLSSTAHAQCSSPTAPAGRIEYFSAAEQVFKYCNGTDWISWGDGGSSIWSDSGSGYIEYTSTLGGLLVHGSTGAPAPAGALGSSGGGTLDGLSDTTLSSPTSGQVLSYNGSAWINSGNAGLWTDSGSGYIEYLSTLGGVLVAPVTALPAATGAVSSGAGGSLDGLTDTTLSSPTNGQVLSYNGSAWVNSGSAGLWSDSGSGYIEYTSTLGGVLIAPITGITAPSGALGSGGGGTLDGLTDTNISSPSNGQVLSYNGSNWVNSGSAGLWSDSGSGYIEYTSTLGGVLIAPVASITAPQGAVGSGGGGSSTLDALTDTTISSPSNGQVLSYNGSAWVNSGSAGLWTDSGSGYIEYTSTLGGILVAPIASQPAPSGAVSTGGGGGGGGTPGGADGQVQFNNSGAFAGDANLIWDDTNGRLGISDGTPDVELDVVGDINYTGVIVDVSDIRMKYDIKPIDSPLRKLSTLNGFSFKMKGDEKEHTEYGVSAQEVMHEFPELVHDVDGDGTLGVAYDGLIAPMIEAIKELKAENEALKARVEALETERKNEMMEP